MAGPQYNTRAAKMSAVSGVSQEEIIAVLRKPKPVQIPVDVDFVFDPEQVEEWDAAAIWRLMYWCEEMQWNIEM